MALVAAAGMLAAAVRKVAMVTLAMLAAAGV